MYIAQCKLIWANSFGGYTKNFSIRSNHIPSQILLRGSLCLPLSAGKYVVKKYRINIELFLLMFLILCEILSLTLSKKKLNIAFHVLEKPCAKQVMCLFRLLYVTVVRETCPYHVPM